MLIFNWTHRLCQKMLCLLTWASIIVDEDSDGVGHKETRWTEETRMFGLTAATAIICLCWNQICLHWNSAIQFAIQCKPMLWKREAFIVLRMMEVKLIPYSQSDNDYQKVSELQELIPDLDWLWPWSNEKWNGKYSIGFHWGIRFDHHYWQGDIQYSFIEMTIRVIHQPRGRINVYAHPMHRPENQLKVLKRLKLLKLIYRIGSDQDCYADLRFVENSGKSQSGFIDSKVLNQKSSIASLQNQC